MPITPSSNAYSQNACHHGASSRTASRSENHPPDTLGTAEQQQRDAVDDEVQSVRDGAEHLAEERDQLDDREHESPFERATKDNPFAVEQPWREHWSSLILAMGLLFLLLGFVTNAWLVVPGLALICSDAFR